MNNDRLMFIIPEGAIWELSLGYDFDREAECVRTPFKTLTKTAIPSREAGRRAAITKPVTCPDCGEEDLYWVKDAEGNDCLAYMYGILRNRLHTCE